MKRDDFPNETIITALNKNRGLLKNTAKSLKHDGKSIARSTLYVWIYGNDKAQPPIPPDDELVQAVINAREDAIDYVESQLFKNIKRREKTSIIFYLKTIGKDRGYVERQEWAEHKEQPLFDDDADETGEFSETDKSPYSD